MDKFGFVMLVCVVLFLLLVIRIDNNYCMYIMNIDYFNCLFVLEVMEYVFYIY